MLQPLQDAFGVTNTLGCFSVVVSSAGFSRIFVSTPGAQGFGVVVCPQGFNMFGSPLGPGRVVTLGGSHVAATSPCLGDLLTSPDGFGVVVSPGRLVKLATLGGFSVVITSEGICVVHVSDVFGTVNSPGWSGIVDRPGEFNEVGNSSGDFIMLSSVTRC